MSVRRRTLSTRLVLTVAMLLTMGFLAACTGKVIVIPTPELYRVTGEVTLAGTNLPLHNAELRFVGPWHRTVTTNRSGTFSLQLAEGAYTVELRTVHGTYTRSIYVDKASHVTWDVQPTGLNIELLYQLSGIREVFWNSATQTVEWRPGELNRWEQSLIRVNFDYMNSTPGAQPHWADQYWTEMLSWQQLLGGRVLFTQVSNPAQADIVVTWVPAGFLGNQVSSRQLQYYENGALRRVTIQIDVRFWDDAALWVHQMAHAMGLSYINDAASVLYPLHLPNTQRATLSIPERDHARIIYDLPSGLRPLGGFGIQSLDVTEGSASDMPLEVTQSRYSGYRGHIVTEDGEVVEMSSLDVRRLMNDN